MKKALLLSVIASTMIMAGGDIAPVEPVVEVEAPAPSGWTFTGQGVVYYQTADMWGAGVDPNSLFDQDSSSANAGVSLKAENKDIIGGLGAGVKLVGVGTLGLEEDVVSNVMEASNAGDLNGGAITELYLTYGIGNTLVKVGRQELPKALSPLAFSESWNVFANTYEAALVVNSDIPNTTLVGAWVRGANSSNALNDFAKANNSDGIFMITAANTSIPDVGITGTVYYAQDYATTDDLTAGWLDVSAKVSGLDVGFQAGGIDAVDTTYAVGAKVGGAFGPVNAGLAVSYVNDEGPGVVNVGGNQYDVLLQGGASSGLSLGENALYTTSALGTNPFATALDSTSVQLCASIDAAGGKVLFIGDYSNTGDMNPLGDGDFMEATLGYATSVGNLDLLAGYVYQKIDADLDEDNNIIRAVARYNF